MPRMLARLNRFLNKVGVLTVYQTHFQKGYSWQQEQKRFPAWNHITTVCQGVDSVLIRVLLVVTYLSSCMSTAERWKKATARRPSLRMTWSSAWTTSQKQHRRDLTRLYFEQDLATMSYVGIPHKTSENVFESVRLILSDIESVKPDWQFCLPHVSPRFKSSRISLMVLLYFPVTLTMCTRREPYIYIPVARAPAPAGRGGRRPLWTRCESWAPWPSPPAPGPDASHRRPWPSPPRPTAAAAPCTTSCSGE